MDESVVRNTQDVDIILNEPDLDRAIEVLGKVGFIFRRSDGTSMFLDGLDAKARDAVHVLFSGKKVREGNSVGAKRLRQENGGKKMLSTLHFLAPIFLPILNLLPLGEAVACAK